MKCEICNGASTCPEGLYVEIRPPVKGEDLIEVPLGTLKTFETWPGYVPTHTGQGLLTLLRERSDDGLELELVGAQQARRIRAHYLVEPTWVGMTTYAVYVRRA